MSDMGTFFNLIINSVSGCINPHSSRRFSFVTELLLVFQVINDGLNKVFVMATGIPQEVEGKDGDGAGDDYLFAVK